MGLKFEYLLKYCRVYELYTSATGLYLCLVIAKGGLMLASWIRQVDILKLNFPSSNSTCDILGLDSPRPPTSRVGKVGREGCDRRVLVDGPHPLALWPPA